MALTKDDFRSMIGEGFHTMLRKGIDGHGSGELWKLIAEMPDGQWAATLDYWVVDPVWKEVQKAVKEGT